jgi:predicted amidophosphoribosyltransferase
VPYRQGLKKKFPDAVDLTDRLSRVGRARSSKDAPLEKLLAGLRYKPTREEHKFRRIAIVDDTYRTGTTAVALISLLREHGLPEECEIIVACPLRLTNFETK